MMQRLTQDVITTIEQDNKEGIKVVMGSELIERESCITL